MLRTLCFALIAATLIVVLVRIPASGCTTGVASGKATADGRPLLWKNRDTSGRDNEVVFFADGRYRYLAVVAAGSSKAAWMGTNEAGFCIENSLSTDLGYGKKGKGPDNGAFMKRALAECATVADFERLLEATNKAGRATVANMGVIDATGGACIFEVGHHTYVKFDANDPKAAPQGYIVRSNFSMTASGKKALEEKGSLEAIRSAERYLRGDAIVREALDRGELDYDYVLRHFVRDMATLEGEPLEGTVNGPAGDLPATIDTTSTICRRTTVSAAVFHGVKPGEDPLETTMWTLLGNPAFSVAVPCWVKAAAVAPELDGKKTSPLCSAAIALRGRYYDKDGHTLQTDDMKEIWSTTFAAEDKIFAQSDAAQARWRRSAPKAKAVLELHRALARRALETVESAAAATAP